MLQEPDSRYADAALSAVVTLRTLFMSPLWCFTLCVVSATVAARIADEVANVTGVVTVNGAALASGKLKLHATGTKKPIELAIKEGKFGPEKIPAGGYSVTIEGAGVPAKYGSEQSTTLKVEISSGENRIDFDLVGEKDRSFHTQY